MEEVLLGSTVLVEVGSGLEEADSEVVSTVVEASATVVEAVVIGAIRIGAVVVLVFAADPSVLRQANDIFVTAVPVDFGLDKSQVCLTNGQQTLVPMVAISPEIVTFVPRLIAPPTGEPVPVASTS